METLLTACRLQVQVRGREAGVPLTGGGCPASISPGRPIAGSPMMREHARVGYQLAFEAWDRTNGSIQRCSAP
jgi:hypothetical protein